jgi:xylan 1,4-beta-xylosidase
MGSVREVAVDLGAAGESYAPVWKKLICAGRAAEALREDWREQCRAVQRDIGFEYIRFHGVLHDDMMVYRERKDGSPLYNFLYVDKVFDFLLSVGLKPFVEFGFMPSDLASGDQTVFYWRGNVTPPKDLAKWKELIRSFLLHCIDRYGFDEVASWYFEVWNEPNVPDDFWGGTQEQYFALYRTTAEAVKSVSPDLRVGGPASSFFVDGKPPWVDELIAYCDAETLPLDFITTHPYPVAWPLEGAASVEKRVTYRGPDATAEDLDNLSRTIRTSQFPGAESHVTEWNSSFVCWDLVHDTAFMAPFVIRNNLSVLGLCDSLGFWTFTDIFEEHGAGEGPFHGGFGLFNQNGIKKPAYQGYELLSRLGNRLVERGDDYVITREGSTLQLLLWNYVHYSESYAAGDTSIASLLDRSAAFAPGEPITFRLSFGALEAIHRKQAGTMTTFDPMRNCAYVAWLELGHPQYLSHEDVKYLQSRTTLDRKHVVLDLSDGVITDLIVPPHGAVLLEIDLF